MKKKFLLFIPIILLALTLTIFVIPTCAADSTYSVWMSEEEYLANPNAPSQVFESSTLDPSGLTGGEYIVLYGNVSLSGALKLNNGTDTVIDLNGNTLTISGSITVGKNSMSEPTYLTVKNGIIATVSNSQAFKPQGNSNTVLENVTVNIGSSNTFIYGDGFRTFTFKDSTVNVNCDTIKSNLFFVAPPLSSWISSFATYDTEENKGKEFKQHLIFDNSIYNDNSTSGVIVKIFDRSNIGGAGINISFLRGSSFNSINSRFFEYLNTNGSKYPAAINIAKGVKFTSPDIPINDLADNIEVNYYNSLEFDGKYITYGELTEPAPQNYQPAEGEPQKLIWGFSLDSDYPHALCNYTVDVKLFDNNGEKIDIDYMGYQGIADGSVLDYEISSGGLFIRKDAAGVDRIYENRHVGWSKDIGSSDYVEKIIATESVSYYAVSKEVGPASLVVLSSNSLELDNVVNPFFDTDISSSELVIPYGGTVLLFDDITLDVTTPIQSAGNTTLDLAGHTLSTSNVFKGVPYLFMQEGASLSVLNGNLTLSAIGLAQLNMSSSLSLDHVNLRYNIAPLFDVKDGGVSLRDCSITQLSTDSLVPTFILARNGGVANVDILNTKIAVSGTLFTHLSNSSSGNMHVNIQGCNEVRACSLFGMQKKNAEQLAAGSMLDFTISGSSVYSDKPFDVPLCNDYTAPLAITARLSSSYFTSDPMEDADAVEFAFSSGDFILAISDEVFKYYVSSYSVDVKLGYSLLYDFTANVYVLANDGVQYLEAYTGKTSVDKLDKVSIDGNEYYHFIVGGISPSDVLTDLYVTVGFTNGNDSFSAKIRCSTVDYFDKLLESGDPLERRLAASVIRYVYSACSYSASYIPTRFVSLMKTDSYQSALRDFGDMVGLIAATDRGNLNVAFTGASLYLSSALSYRFNLRSDFSGTVLIFEKSYTVTDGRVNGKEYIDVLLPTHTFYNSLIQITGYSVSGTEISGEYSLGDYVLSQSQAVQSYQLAMALYTMSYEAMVCKNGGVLPPYTETLPPMDIIIK